MKNEKFEVCIEIDRDKSGERYYIYKELNGAKLWVTKEKKLDRCIWSKAHVNDWEDAVKIANQILNGEIR